MRFRGWERKYGEILREFGFSRKEDLRAAKILDSILDYKHPLGEMDRKIRDRPVFVIGAGPSLSSCLATIGKYRHVTKMVADGAVRALIEKGIRPDIVVSDLDGNLEYLKKSSKMNAIMVVHSHGDNIGRLPIAMLFRKCIGTTEARPFGKIRNFGGFTDGDRCVFLATNFAPRSIVMFGMDFGKKIGSYSKDGTYDKKMKVAKLAKARSLLEWLATKSDCGLYTTSEPLKGFQKISFADVERLTREKSGRQLSRSDRPLRYHAPRRQG